MFVAAGWFTLADRLLKELLVNEPIQEIPISLIRGGSLYWVQEKAKLIRPQTWDLQRRLPVALAVAWLPLLVLALIHGGFQDLHALLLDYRVYARVFIAIPLLLIGQIMMEMRFREMAQHFLDANIIRIDEIPRFREIMQSARRLRDAKLPELLVILAVFAQAGYFLESGRLHFASWAVQAGSNSPTAAGFYSILVAHALFLTLLGIALWKWVIWVYVLRQISRMDLQLDATNGDLNGGLGFLGEVPRAFVPVVLAISAVIGATWRSQVLTGQAGVRHLEWTAGFLAVLILLIFFLPLALFTPKLLHEKRDGSLMYGSLRHLHSLQFRQKWTEHRNEHVQQALGNPDFSSLADISTSFKNVEDMVTYPFRKSAVVALLVALALPMIPVITTQIPFKDLLKDLFEAIH
jgi:hypothetical protein